MRSALSVFTTLVLLTASTATAQPQPAENEVPEADAPATRAELETVAVAAREAAEAAKAAAEAAKASADALKQALAPKPAAEAAAPTPSAWQYQLGVNAIAISGNANAVTGKVTANVDGTWTNWAVQLRSSAAYGQSSLPNGTETQITALNGNLSLRGDRKIGEELSAYVLGGALADHVANIELQSFGELGLGLRWFEVVEGDFVKARLRTDLGFRFTREARYQYFPGAEDLPDVDLVAARLSGSFRYALNRTTVLTEELEILPDIPGFANLRMTSTTALAVQIDKGIAVQLSFKARYIQAPAGGAVPLDTETAGGITWTF